VSDTALHAERLTQGETRWSIPLPLFMRNPSLLRALARSFLAGEPTVEQIAARAGRTLGRQWRWLRPLAQRYLNAVAHRTRPRHRDVVRFLLNDRNFGRAWSRYFHELSVSQWIPEPQEMQPVAAAVAWDVPRIESVGALCDWLWLDVGELEWFADLKGLANKKNTEILDKIPPHPAAHGFIKGRSIRTFAARHAGQRVVLRMDLSDFFPTVSAARIQTVFRAMGYPEPVADLLGGICTNAAPRDLCAGLAYDARSLYSRAHLPQGAPTSPALANLCTHRADCRLTGLAESAGAKYTRYADDLAFSGGEDFERRVERFSTHVAAILLEEGFAVNHRKTRIMRRGVRQHLAGLVVNEHMNVRRRDFDLLKATLANCARLGPEGQNRGGHADFRAHLEGKVGFVESLNPAKGRRLRAAFERIQW